MSNETDAADNASATDPDVQHGDHGTSRYNYPRLDDNWSAFEVYGDPGQNTSLAVTGYKPDDEPPLVELQITHDLYTTSVTLSPDRARVLAAQLNDAASNVEDTNADE